jgi:hypothetical protein
MVTRKVPNAPIFSAWHPSPECRFSPLLVDVLLYDRAKPFVGENARSERSCP